MKRLTQGSIIEIHVHHEYYVYAQFLKNSFIAIFDGKYSKPVCSTKELNTQNVLFIICVSISDMIKLIFFPIQLWNREHNSSKTYWMWRFGAMCSMVW